MEDIGFNVVGTIDSEPVNVKLNNLKIIIPIMKVNKFLLAMFALLPVEALACTSLIAGKNATTDGSVLVTYAADSHTLYVQPSRW